MPTGNAVELISQPPVSHEYTGAKYATRVFRVFGVFPSREQLNAAPEQVDAALPPRGDTWDGMQVDRIDVKHDATTSDVIYSYSNTRQTIRTALSFQTEQVEVPYFAWRGTRMPTTGIVTSYDAKFLQIPQRIARLRVSVQFPTAQDTGGGAWSLASLFQSAVSYTNSLFDLSNTVVFNQPVGSGGKLWMLEGVDMQEMVRAVSPSNGAGVSWIVANYSFVREPGLRAGEDFGLGGANGRDIAAGRLPTPWRISGDVALGREDIMPPKFQSSFQGISGEWAIPPFERILGRPDGIETAEPRRPYVPAFHTQPIAVVAPDGWSLPGIQ